MTSLVPTNVCTPPSTLMINPDLLLRHGDEGVTICLLFGTPTTSGRRPDWQRPLSWISLFFISSIFILRPNIHPCHFGWFVRDVHLDRLTTLIYVSYRRDPFFCLLKSRHENATSSGLSGLEKYVESIQFDLAYLSLIPFVAVPISILYSVSIACAIYRIFHRYVIKRLWWDDYTAIIPPLLSLVFWPLFLVSFPYRLGGTIIPSLAFFALAHNCLVGVSQASLSTRVLNSFWLTFLPFILIVR